MILCIVWVVITWPTGNTLIWINWRTSTLLWIWYKDFTLYKDKSSLDIGGQTFHIWNNYTFKVVWCHRYLLGLCLYLRDKVSDIDWIGVMRLNFIQYQWHLFVVMVEVVIMRHWIYSLCIKSFWDMDFEQYWPMVSLSTVERW